MLLPAVLAIAEDPAAAFDIVKQIGPVGTGAILALVLLRKLIVPEWIYRQAEERHAAERAADAARIARLEEALNDSNQLLIREVVPALTQSTAALQRAQGDRDDPRDDQGAKPRGSGRGR